MGPDLTLAHRHPQHLSLLDLPLCDYGLDVLYLLVWGKVAELRILSNNSLDVDRGSNLSRLRGGSLWSDALLLLGSYNAHHGLLLLMLGHKSLLLGIMTHHNWLLLPWMRLARDLQLHAGIL